MYIPADYKKTLLQRVCFNLFFDEQELEIELNEAESLLARPDQGVHRHVAHQNRQESGRIPYIYLSIYVPADYKNTLLQRICSNLVSSLSVGVCVYDLLIFSHE